MPAPNSRPVHPCLTSVFDGTRGAEYSTWAFISTSPPQCPNLVTAQASTLRVYTLDETNGKLCQYLESTLAGNICYLETLPAADGNHSDSLLLGFCGHPRLTICSVVKQSQSSPTPTVFSATSLIDLTQALIDSSYGSVTPLSHDLVATSVSRKNDDHATLAVILGNGVAVACVDLARSKNKQGRSGGGWMASEPFLLPLNSLQASIQRSQTTKSQSASGNSGSGGAASASAAISNVPSIATGFGDVLSATFLPGYSEPAVVLLHSNPASHGRVWSGRMGRPHWQPATRYGMLVTAISVTVAHQRSAVLWSVEVPADAISVHRVGLTGCLVLCANSLLTINNAGRIHDLLAVNGYARSTCPTRLLEVLKPNPKPFPKLAIQLDGAALAFCSDRSIVLSLRAGSLYLLQFSASLSGKSTVGLSNGNDSQMSLVPLGRALGACGNIANLIAWPLATVSDVMYDKFTGIKGEEEMKKNLSLSMGLLFSGSRVGDSILLAYCLEFIDFPWIEESGGAGKKIKLQDRDGQAIEEEESVYNLDNLPSHVSSELDDVMKKEEDALYLITDSQEPDVVPPSDEESVTKSSTLSVVGKRKQPRLSQVAVLRALTALDSITGLGPLGPSCEGPIVMQNQQEEGVAIINPDAATVPGSSALIVPCGFGSSGGVGIVTAPGRDERPILAEVDCLGVESVFSLRKRGLVLVGTADAGIRVLRLQHNSEPFTKSERKADSADLIELEHDECLASSSAKGDGSLSTREVFEQASLLSCTEFVDGAVALALSISKEEHEGQQHAICVLKESTAGLLEVTDTFLMPDQEEKGLILSMTPMTIGGGSDNSTIVFACTWSVGAASLVVFNARGFVKSCDLKGSPDEDEIMGDADSENAVNAFYASKRIVAVDIFKAPSNFFANRDRSDGKSTASQKDNTASRSEPNLEDDDDLYNIAGEDDRKGNQGFTGKDSQAGPELWKTASLFLGVCRQSGDLEIFSVSDMMPDQEPTPFWSAKGCGHGVSSLSQSGPDSREPRLHEVCVREMRFFVCGSTAEGTAQHYPGLSRAFCLAVETTDGDFHLYTADERSDPQSSLRLGRLPLKCVTRQSQEQTRFASKLRRRGIVKDGATPDGRTTFIYNKLHRFHALSQQDGLFASTARPLWLLAERGRPTAVVHRLRHASPAGGKPYPVSGFCSDLDGTGAFLTVHERVGRFGSQRLTLYEEISNVFNVEGLLPGGGFCLEKIPLGVTVRRIEFIDDATVSSQGCCLYAMLVSRELEVDMSQLNDDGMAPEERERLEKEKEAAKISRQVQADLGGFDVEQEWVEEIEREDCFEIDKELGGAPPLLQCSYALWIVDAANNFSVVDSYELGEFDHGMTMRVMSLTEFPEEPGTASTSELAGDEMESKLFITVGVGIVDKNGEDVSSKGRVLLFDVTAKKGDQRVELGLVCEKDIFHGPVTCLSCLSSEGKHRLVIGAGADINVEQFGNGKLTQVGFYRATMQVLDVFMFKNFLLLSDAYDSLYFLVWRESDKSLTLLSKDYDPLVVYAAGTISRGGALSFVSHDDRQNLQFFQYAPGEAAARGGNKLVCRSDFHLGSQIAAFQNHTCRSSLWINSASPSSTLAALKQQDAFFGRSEDDQRLGAHFGTSDGGFGSIVPLSEPVYWRLAALQSVMANALENDCALSQRAWRLYHRSFRRGGCRSTDRKKGVIDGDQVSKYTDLPLADQEDLASAIGSTVGLILDNLLELNCATAFI